MKTNLAVSLLACLALLFVSAPGADALSCLPSPSAEEEFAQAAAVFVGRAEAVDNPEMPDENAKNRARFKVDRVYKGALPSKLVVESDGIWGMRFEAGKDYLVYLDSLNPYTVALCKFASTELSEAGDRIAQIENAGHEPAPPAAARNNLYGNPYVQYGSAAGLLALGYLAFRLFSR